MAYYIPSYLVKLSSQTASSSSTISFTSLINSNYSTYLVRIRTAVPASNAVNMTMLFSTNNGTSYLSTNYAYGYDIRGSTNSDVGSSTDTSLFIAGSQITGSGTFLNSDIMLYDMNSGTYSAKFNSNSVVLTSSTNFATVISGGMNTGTTAVNAIEFKYSSGNISSGTFTLYGVKDS